MAVVPSAPLSYAHDVFVSYGHKDKTWVHGTLLARFKDEEIKAANDRDDMPIGMPIPRFISEEVPRSRHIICVMTPDWVESIWGREEMSLGFGRADGARDAALLPILLKPCDIPALLSRRRYCDLSALKGPQYESEFRHLIATIKQSRNYGVAMPLSPEPEAVRAQPAVQALEELTVILKDDAKKYRQFFKRVGDDIRRLADFKDVHDQLHKLQIEFQKVVLSDLAAGNRFAYRLYRMVLKAVISEVQEVRDRMTTDEFGWIKQLEQADTLFGEAMTEQDEARASEALLLVQTVLQRHTASVNSGVTTSIKALRLDELLETVTALCRDASERAKDELQMLQKGGESLGHLARNLAVLVHEHDEWQHVDGDLRFIDRLLEIPLIRALAESQVPMASDDQSADVATIGVMWPAANKAVTDLARADNIWLSVLAEQKEVIEAALAAKKMPQLRDNYSLYRRATVERFFKVDRSLKLQCDELRLVGAQLDQMSRMLA